MTAKVGSFMKGLRGEHATLDDVLAGKVVDKKYRLIDLARANVSYDSAKNSVTVHRAHISSSVHVQVRPEFHDYMKQYGHSVRYVTRNGTPWLTEAEKSDPEKTATYFEALASGPKEYLAFTNWTKTDGKKLDTGHSSLSVGKLDLQPAEAPDGTPVDPRRVEGYDQHAAGSFYPSQSAWREQKAFAQAQRNDAGKENPSAHARGVMTRNSLKPSAAAAAAGGAVATASALANRHSKKKGGPLRTALQIASVVSAGYAAGFVVAAVQSSPGSIRIKDEPRAHGLMATLISPAQHDILEHNLMGLSKTYHGKYNVFKSNCADFAEDMLRLVGVDARELVQTAMETEPAHGKKLRKPTEVAIPRHIRPDRNSWAMREMQAGQEGLLKVDGQELSLRKIDLSGHSTIMIEASDGELLKHPPIEMMDRVLSLGMNISAPLGPNRAEFAYSGEVKTPKAGLFR
jgi:hypothetical protein